MGQSEIKTTEELFGSSKTTDEIKWAEPTQIKAQPMAQGRNLGQQLAAPYHSFASGFYKGVGDIASDVSEFTQRAPTGQLARLINEKILGREPGWTREQFGKVIDPVTKTMGGISEAQGQGGLGKSMLGQVYEGLGHFGATAPALYGLGAAGAGATTLPILEGVSGYAKEGLLGGVKGAVHGAMTHKILRGISVLPTEAQPLAALAFGAATTPGGIKERTAGGLTWAALGMAGGNKRVTKEDFISNYPKWGKRIDEGRARRVVKQLAPELTAKEIAEGGGAKKLLEESLRAVEKDPTKPIEPERTTKTTQELEAGIATLKENYGKPDADRKTLKMRLREANSELKYVRKKDMQTNTPARRELDKALNAVRANEKILNDYAKLNEVPGAEHGIVKYKEGGTTEVTSKDVMELIKRGPDLKMGLVERRTTPMVWVAQQFPWVRRLFERYHIADKAYLKEFEHTQKAYTNRWQKELKNDGLDLGNSSERIATYLTGLQKNGDAILKIMGKSKLTDADMTPAEMKIVTEARVVYDKMFKRINRARELAGKEPLEYVEDYFTWMRNLQQLEDAGVSLVEADAWVANVQLAATPLKYANTRKGLVKSGVILDFFQVFDGYAKDAIKHIHYTPFIAKGRALLEPHEIPSTKMKKDGTPGKITYSLEYDKPVLRQLTKEWLDTVAGKSQLHHIPDYAKVQKGVAELNSNIAFAVLSANLRSAMIQFTAIRGAITEAGTSHTAKGVLQNLSPTMRKFAMQHSKVLFGRSVDIHVISAINQSTGGKIRNIKRALGEIGLKPLQILDMETARGAWLSFYSKAGGRGVKSDGHKEAVRKADEAVLRTQASGKIGDVSPLQRGPTGRLISLFQTFTISEWNWIMRDVIGIKNPEANLGKNVVRAMRFMVTTTLINALFEDLLDVPSPFPAPEQAVIKGVQEGKGVVDTALSAGRELLEQIPVVGGAIKYSTDWKTNLPVPALQLTQDTIKLISKLSQGQIGKINEYDLETLGKALGIPGTSQARKFLVRIKRGQTIPEALIGVREGKKKTSGVDKYTPGIY